NVVLITADDLNCSSVGVYGCRVPDITPHIDQLAAEGIRFSRSHVTTAVCMPSRGALLTGLYPMHSGVEGFKPTQKDIPTVMCGLKQVGYLCAVLGKVEQSAPKTVSEWDVNIAAGELGAGRNPDL